jgi:hypothetical protein
MVSGIRRRYLALAAILGLVAGCTVAATSFATGGASARQAKSSATERSILRVALRAAAQAGDATPTLIQHSVGTRYRANLAASGEIAGGQQRSYLIAERGHFVLADVGPGNQTIRGSVITLVYNAKTRDVSDYGLQNNYPNLAALGPVTTDYKAAGN